ncbi:ParB/RepB/Spo0J family partition protein [Streptomyces paromomycinus]|uniref:Transcriptional regulator NovG n=1 Tax=Streptomyces paromomycinus TaxID=92743 RepID=A0A401WE52_STREY|nr:ParB N-terminal domain-containing protein [Streptomyces paromomycinus]GCD47613.1 transcriptional regulator NovG [Streptomyces paromomycinus]
MSLAQTVGTAAGVAGRRGGEPEIVSVPIIQVLPGDSPRLTGEDKGHVLRLAAIEGTLPPILVDRRTMCVIDGLHRLMAASLKGQKDIDVRFFDGSREEAFLKSVEANVEHGLPLSQADRTAAALRILKSHPTMADRAIAKSTGLGARTVAQLRRSSDSVPQSDFRVGRDGKVRPLDGAQGRLRVAELMRDNPDASLRQVARSAGVSPATALDVRRRLERGDQPVPSQRSRSRGEAGPAKPEPVDPPPVPVAAPPTAATLDKLMRDPSLRQSELGRRLLRMFRENVLGASEMNDICASVPSHCIELIVELSRRNSQIWDGFAQELNRRARIVNPD